MLLAGDAGYEDARSLWNGAIDRRPAVIARCTSAAHVADAIRYARDSGLEIAVRGGGHNYAGHASCDGGMMIHLGAMNAVGVSAAAARRGATSTPRLMADVFHLNANIRPAPAA